MSGLSCSLIGLLCLLFARPVGQEASPEDFRERRNVGAHRRPNRSRFDGGIRREVLPHGGRGDQQARRYQRGKSLDMTAVALCSLRRDQNEVVIVHPPINLPHPSCQGVDSLPYDAYLMPRSPSVHATA